MSRHDIGARTGIVVLVLVLGMVLHANFIAGQPSGATIVSNTTVTPSPAAAGSLTTAGGSFTTLLLNATTQNPRWKAYVGNISGTLNLADGSGGVIYDWNLAVITGEVYASRNDSVDWSLIQCANRTTIENEDSFLNINASNEDSINNTFNETVHQTFFTGSQSIQNSTCPAIATYVNSTAQAESEAADFQEILLQSNTTLVYATVLEQDSLGYADGSTFDFQLIVAEDEFAETPTTYYFYAELG